jgi:hypothetical protein
MDASILSNYKRRVGNFVKFDELNLEPILLRDFESNKIIFTKLGH